MIARIVDGHHYERRVPSEWPRPSHAPTSALALAPARAVPPHNISPVRVSYDEEANAAYLHLGDASLRPIKTVPVPDIDPWTVNLDFDAAGRLLGIEVLDAREVLPSDFLARFANRIAKPS